MEGRGSAWELSRFPGLEWVGQSPSTPFPLLLEGPSCLPLLISPASLLCPQYLCGPDRALGCGGTSLGAQQAPQPEWARRSPSAPLPPFPESPSHLPLLISLALGCRSCLTSISPPSQSPYALPVHFGVPPVSLGVRVPHQWLAGTLVVGRRQICIFPHHHLDSASITEFFS